MLKIFCTIFLLFLISQSKLVHLSQLFRHGARYPVSNIYDGNETKALHGSLTGVGMRQQYLLGSYLRRDYTGENSLFSSTLNPREVEIFSDGSQRCYDSAYAHATGLFSLDNG
jgi:broad specificity phosphatase PhoE